MGNVIVILVLAVLCFFAIRSMWKDHKNGGCCGCSGCSGGCSGDCASEHCACQNDTPET